VRIKAFQRQRGVAVITALLLTTLAITIVASLFWQQQVEVRSIENQRLQLQKQWILRGALDWANVILMEDMRTTGAVDTLQEDWAVPLADTPLDQYVENGREDSDASDASLSGHIIDAQSRYNLRSLSSNGVVNPNEVEVFARLLANLNLNTALAKPVANAMAAAEIVAPAFPGAGSPSTTATTTTTTAPVPTQAPVSSHRLMGIVQVEDLLSVPGITPAVLAKLKDFVIVLPNASPYVNVNTTTAEVLAAKIKGLSLSDAKALIAIRDHTPFRNLGEMSSALNNPAVTLANLGAANLQVYSNYFLVNGKVKLNRASSSILALVRRDPMSPRATVEWIRQD
jgi:general secretion pathway protein K